ncbi:MAG: ThuA domain-containing protein [Armatimonadetes bacterium]|nr:ThuA domain-containing protein [Armatimonadota bacterium]
MNILRPVRTLVVTGGHDFEREPFFAMLGSFEGISYEEVQHPHAHARLTPAAAREYDVILLYDMWQPISEDSQRAFVQLLRAGKGLVALHHSLASYQQWEEYRQIIGGRWYADRWKQNGVERPPSTYKHDVVFRVRIVDRRHPVTRDIQDFDIRDETYGNFEVLPTVQPLLMTDEPSSHPVIGWAHTYGRSRVVYIQLGHDHHAYENPSYRRLVQQAIRWVHTGAR